MPVEEIKTVKWYSINKKGRIRSTSGADKDHQYESLWGVLVGIELKEDVYDGEETFKYQFKLEDPIHSHLEILQVGEASSAARGIIMSLFSIPTERIHLVNFAPYTKTVDEKTYTNVWVKYAEDTGQQWQDTEWDKVVMEHLPDVKEVKVRDKTYLDDTDRRKYIQGLAARIKKTRLNIRADQVQSKEVVDEDTGEVLDGRKVADDVYKEPVEKHQQKSSSELDDRMADMDDDLPF